ncbi:MAG: 50S ribosomal protein L19e [Candidatus Aenigmarchaeota archaeon]|nr:50S ribosomal protein L19e [Candidatus Aenigmarchaeota archaeon]
MPNVQKRMAAKVMKAGISRVWFNPDKLKDIEKAITNWDIRKLIKKGDIKIHPKKVRISVAKVKRKRGHGSKEGKKYSIVSRKSRWMAAVRTQRRMIKELKDESKLDNVSYRSLYGLIKGGMFRSRAHLKLYIEQNKMLK